ncbi:partial Regulatory protein AfsR, partial [Anaerolineae bacterium]
VRYQFPDGIVWLEVGKSANAASLLGRAGELLGDQRSEYQNEPDAKARLAFWTSGKTALFVLDDVWDHQIAEVFKGVGKTCRLVVTTRQPQIVNKLGAASQTVDRLTEDEGIRLIDKHLGRPSEAPRPHDTVERVIVRLLEGHTLSVHIAAARLRERGADFAPTLLSRLQNPDRLFKDLKMDETDKNHNLEVSLAESYSDLKADGQRRFRALGVFAPEGTYDPDALKAVWADKDEVDTDDGIDLLTRTGLLMRLEDGRYRLHNLLRAYARALAAGEMGELFVRYCKWVTEQAAQFEAHPPEAWGAFEPHLAPHLLEAGDRLVKQVALVPAQTTEADGLIEHALTFARNVSHYLNNRREVRRVEWLEMGLVVARRSEDQKHEALFLNVIGDAWAVLGEKRKALEYYEQAMLLRRTVGDLVGEASTLNNIGVVWDAFGEARKALEYYKQALLLNRVVGDKKGEATTLNNIGGACAALGETHKALEHYKQALLLDRVVGDRYGEGTTLNNIGLAWFDLGERRKALEYYEQALTLRRASGDLGGEATTLTNIGGAWGALGKAHKALEYYEQALPLFRTVGDRGGEATTLLSLGLAWFDLGEKGKALEYYEQALPLFRAVGDRRAEASTLNSIGGVWAALGKMRKALDYYRRALPLSRAVGDRRAEAYTLHNMSFIHEEAGNLKKAIDCETRSVALLETIGDKNVSASMHNLKRLKLKRGGRD